MRYVLPIVPESWETFKEGLFGALSVLLFPFVLFYFLVKVCPVFVAPGDGPAPVELDG
jgi:hypothetical protein